MSEKPQRLSQIRPDWREGQMSLDPEVVRAANKHSDLQSHSPKADQPYERDTRPLHPDPNEFKLRPMTTEECVEYANAAQQICIKHRITKLNEMISDIDREDTIHEYEALMLIIKELELVLINTPGYTDPTYGTKAEMTV